MSGRKDAELQDSVSALAEALRQAAERARREAERRREEHRRVALARFDASMARLSQQWTSLKDEGLAPVVAYALEGLAEHRASLAGLAAEEIDRRREAVEERGALIDHAAQTIGSLGNRGKGAAVATIPAIRSDDDLRAALAQTLSAGLLLDRYDGIVHRAREAMAFLGACDAARVPLTHEISTARSLVQAFLDKPSLTTAEQAEVATARMRPGYLEERLSAQRDLLASGLEVLLEPERRPLLEAWRDGFAKTVEQARMSLGRSDWTAAVPALRELDDFMDARAQGRLRMVIDAARATGLQATEPTRDGDGRWAANISDATGLLFAASESVPSLHAGANLEVTLEVRGPENFDGPACVTAGLGQVAGQLRKQGVGIRVFDGKQGELPLGLPEGPEPAAPHRKRARLRQ